MHPWVKVGLVPLIAIGVYEGGQFLARTTSPSEHPASDLVPLRFTPGGGPAPTFVARSAGPYQSKLVDREVTVASVRRLKTTINLTDAGGQVIVCRPDQLPAVPESLVASTLHIRGHTAMAYGKERVLAAQVTVKGGAGRLRTRFPMSGWPGECLRGCGRR